jgi:hypothetical protein
MRWQITLILAWLACEAAAGIAAGLAMAYALGWAPSDVLPFAYLAALAGGVAGAWWTFRTVDQLESAPKP